MEKQKPKEANTGDEKREKQKTKNNKSKVTQMPKTVIQMPKTHRNTNGLRKNTVITCQKQ